MNRFQEISRKAAPQDPRKEDAQCSRPSSRPTLPPIRPSPGIGGPSSKTSDLRSAPRPSHSSQSREATRLIRGTTHSPNSGTARRSWIERPRPHLAPCYRYPSSSRPRGTSELPTDRGATGETQSTRPTTRTTRTTLLFIRHPTAGHLMNNNVDVEQLLWNQAPVRTSRNAVFRRSLLCDLFRCCSPIPGLGCSFLHLFNQHPHGLRHQNCRTSPPH